ncbi:unnamed protein product, partial [Ectocarpus sp. 13 AM-2016]
RASAGTIQQPPLPQQSSRSSNVAPTAMHTVMGLTIPTRPVFMVDRLTHEDDATKLTAFPTPGDPRRRPLVQFDWDESENVDEKRAARSRRRKGAAASRGYRGISEGVAREGGGAGGAGGGAGGVPGVITLNPKMHWMPDRMCRVCYGCNSPFTMFRRRHHCRVCGQIFCHTCSSNHVDARALGINASVRMCNACAEQLPDSRLRRLEAGPLQDREAKDTAGNPRRSSSKRRRSPLDNRATGGVSPVGVSSGGQSKRERGTPPSFSRAPPEKTPTAAAAATEALANAVTKSAIAAEE